LKHEEHIMAAKSDVSSGDIQLIKALVARQFAALSWRLDKEADWEAFKGDFHPEAALFASARPARGQTPGAFAARMKSLSQTSLRSFDETVLGVDVRVFGNVATASVGCEALENGAEMNRNVEMMLLVKEEGRWKIVAQAWDKASSTLPLPGDLAS
jgi:Putative lumazine-binding